MKECLACGSFPAGSIHICQPIRYVYAIPPHRDGGVPPPPVDVRWATDIRDFLKRALAGDKTPPTFSDTSQNEFWKIDWR